MGFLFKAGFDEFADSADFEANSPFRAGASSATLLEPDTKFGVPGGKFLSTSLTRDQLAQGPYSRLVPLPISGHNQVCFGGSLIVPDVTDPFSNALFTDRPLMVFRSVEVRFGTGTSGRNNKLVLAISQDPDNRGNAQLFESDFELVGGGMYYITVSIQAESDGFAGDARIVLKANKTTLVDTGTTVTLVTEQSPTVRYLRNTGVAHYYSPTPDHHYGWDNVFCKDEFEDPPFFYVEQLTLATADRLSWGMTGDQQESEVQKLTDGDDGTQVFSTVPDQHMTATFESAPVLAARKLSEVTLKARMSRGSGGLADVEVICSDGVSQYGTGREAVVGANADYVEQRIVVPLSSIQQLSTLQFDIYNRNPPDL